MNGYNVYGYLEISPKIILLKKIPVPWLNTPNKSLPCFPSVKKVNVQWHMHWSHMTNKYYEVPYTTCDSEGQYQDKRQMATVHMERTYCVHLGQSGCKSKYNMTCMYLRYFWSSIGTSVHQQTKGRKK